MPGAERRRTGAGTGSIGQRPATLVAGLPGWPGIGPWRHPLPSVRFLKEVHAGDTLYPQLEILELTTQGDTGIVTTRATVHNQRGELVLDGEHTYSLKASSTDATHIKNEA